MDSNEYLRVVLRGTEEKMGSNKPLWMKPT